MARTTFSMEEMERIGGLEKGWLELWRFSAAAPFPCEMAARRNRNFQAAKCLLLCTDEKLEPRGDASLQAFCETILEIGPRKISVLILASDRPITYFPELDFAENYQLEIPGGVAEPNENQRQAALREAIEEGGLPVSGEMAFIQSASLVPVPCPWDAGTHAEVYSIETALVHGRPQPPEKEGIIPDKCQLVSLRDAADFLRAQRQKGICVEGYALTALAMLENFLWRTWCGKTFPQNNSSAPSQ